MQQNRSTIWSKFTYDYTFEMDYGKSIKVAIDYLFDDVSELETLSCFPHAQRRKFARHVLEHYQTAEKYHQLSATDIINPFARRLDQLFESGMQIYWTRRPTDTLMIVTGIFRPKMMYLIRF